MIPSLRDFPQEFGPLVVVVGDRRETQPKSSGDLLAYSASAVDLLYLNSLSLPKDTLILSDKTFAIEREEVIASLYSNHTILTIGSPAVNLFSRKINDSALIRFEISPAAKAQMKLQEAIVNEYKLDPDALFAYKCIVQDGSQSPEDMVRLSRGKLKLSDYLRATFVTLQQKVKASGLDNYRELLRSFEGKSILNPIKGDEVDFSRPQHIGDYLNAHKDYGLVSIAKHPYSDSKDRVVLYVAGRHGPATAHGVRMLAEHTEWDCRPYGGAFEVKIPDYESFSRKLHYVQISWEVEQYKLGPLSAVPMQAPSQQDKPQKSLSAFISAPIRPRDRRHRAKVQWIASLVKEAGRSNQQTMVCAIPSENPSVDKWNYVDGIIKHFPSAALIVHELTQLSPGVLFEVGCSYGFCKTVVIIWDDAVEPFRESRLPKLLRFADVLRFDYSKRDAFRSPLIAQMTSQIQPSQSVTTSSKNVGDRQRVLVFVDERWDELKEVLVQRLHQLDKVPVFCESAIAPHNNPIESVVFAMRTCASVIVSVTEKETDGFIALGIARAMNRHSLELIHADAPDCSMFDGLKCHWRIHTMKTDVGRALSRFFPKTTKLPKAGSAKRRTPRK